MSDNSALCVLRAGPPGRYLLPEVPQRGHQVEGGPRGRADGEIAAIIMIFKYSNSNKYRKRKNMFDDIAVIISYMDRKLLSIN